MADTEAPTRQPNADTGDASIYERHATGLRNRCLRLTGDPVRADDLMQEVFARFLAKFPEPPPAMNVHGYLLATARNIWINQARSERAIAIDQIDEVRIPDDRIENDPVRSILLAEQQSYVRTSTAALTDRQRRALTLRELDNRSYAEIGADLDLGSNAVAQIVWRARGQLRRSIRRSQVDVDRIPAECRAMLDDMSDLVDEAPSRGAAELEAHMTDCPTCRTTLASYQEAGSSFRGAIPFVPVLALMTRVGGLLRASVEAPAAIGTAAAITAAVVATAGGGGTIVAHYAAASPGKATSRSVRSLERFSSAPRAAFAPTLELSTAGRPTGSDSRQSGIHRVVLSQPTNGRAKGETRRVVEPIRTPAPAPVPVRASTTAPGSQVPTAHAPGDAPSTAVAPPPQPAIASKPAPGKIKNNAPATAAVKGEAPGNSKPRAKAPKSRHGKSKSHAPETASVNGEAPRKSKELMAKAPKSHPKSAAGGVSKTQPAKKPHPAATGIGPATSSQSESPTPTPTPGKAASAHAKPKTSSSPATATPPESAAAPAAAAKKNDGAPASHGRSSKGAMTSPALSPNPADPLAADTSATSAAASPPPARGQSQKTTVTPLPDQTTPPVSNAPPTATPTTPASEPGDVTTPTTTAPLASDPTGPGNFDHPHSPKQP